MQTDIVAIGYLIASQLIISIIFFILSLKIGKVALAAMLIRIDERILEITNQIGSQLYQ
ncbi:unnamed protein product [marine sediment metagenome]|uniref:Uncharacterized protein n=1 Tax=marine sediment metagenome TaxID=412755 RepID=X1KG38_9ZZZZ